MRRSLTLRLPVDALLAAPTEALERLARAMELGVTRRAGESEGAYRGRLRHAIQRAEGAAKAGRRWLVDE